MTLASLQIYDYYGLALTAVIGTLFAVIAIQWFIQFSPWAGWAQSLAGVAPPFINIIGVIFGLSLAFLANDTWSAHDRAMGTVYHEADSLRSIVALGKQLPTPLQTELRATVADYAQASADEWPQLAQRSHSPAVMERSDALLAVIARQELAQAAGNNVQMQMLRKAGEIRDDHDLRVALSKTHVNPLKWMGMAFLGFLTLLSVAVVHVERPRAALVAVLLFALAAAPTAAIVLVQGNPFQQPSSVNPAPIAAVATELR